jgi:hypothetical protein
MLSSAVLRGVTLVRTNVSEERTAPIVRVIKIGDLALKRQLLKEPHGITSHKMVSFIEEVPRVQ